VRDRPEAAAPARAPIGTAGAPGAPEARAWARLADLDPADAAFIRAHVPPPVDAAELATARRVTARPDWVLKRALGRVGDEVVVGDLADDAEGAAITAAVAARRAGGERWIAQRYVVDLGDLCPAGAPTPLALWLGDGFRRTSGAARRRRRGRACACRRPPPRPRVEAAGPVAGADYAGRRTKKVVPSAWVDVKPTVPPR
jgi:hypothetical protein